jgi:hypothetical protein
VSFVTLRMVEVFKPGHYKGHDYDAHAVGQCVVTLRYLCEDPETARVLGFGDSPKVPVLDGHDPNEEIGYLEKLYEDRYHSLLADLAVAEFIAADIRDRKITGVSAAVPCVRGIYRLAHVALVRPPDRPYVQDLRPLRECLPEEYRT